MRLGDVGNNTMLIHLSLARCRLQTVDNVILKNLHIFDLGHNQITSFDLVLLNNFPQLRILVLLGNPLTDGLHSTGSVSRSFLREFDLFYVALPELNLTELKVLRKLEVLNISHSDISQLTDQGLHVLPRLQVLDFSDCPLSTLPGNATRDLVDLRLMMTHDYRLCCPQLLPRTSTPRTA
jgi:Leucine-rich repeat (LRR) protein